MMTNYMTNTYLTYQIDLPNLWNFPTCWSSLCEEIVEDLDMACGHGNLLTLGCCTSWPQLAQAGPRWLKQPVKTLMSIGLYPSREGHQSFYPQIPAHFRTWKLCLLAHIPPGRGTGVFIHGSLHISRHGNSICWPVSLQAG